MRCLVEGLVLLVGDVRGVARPQGLGVVDQLPVVDRLLDLLRVRVRVRVRGVGLGLGLGLGVKGRGCLDLLGLGLLVLLLVLGVLDLLVLR